ncbi:MAG: ATP-binding protein [Chlamydiae bacterium]|nr:ATP-binding protein [Chlamydiota bacterium]
MYIPQSQINHVKKLLKPGKVVVIHGPRRVGKTTLLKKILENESNFISVSGEDLFIQKILSSQSIAQLTRFIQSKDLLVIDEAQQIPNIGINLKLIVDHIPHVRVIVTGSSAFDLANKTGEPLTGRKYTLKMYPISQIELSNLENLAKTQSELESRLLFGSYPEVVLFESDEERKAYLFELVSSYLLKDILMFEGVKKSKKMIDLLILIAFQIGKEVSLSELATNLGINKVTVERYLDLLEKVFVIVNIRGYSRNLRSEVTKTSRYYFCDNGIRNALINNFNLLCYRNDVGQLWENYLVIERLKKQEYNNIHSNNYFWRTYDQKEIDWIEERDGKLYAYEFKWNEKVVKCPTLFKNTYSDSDFECINLNNYLEFIT